MVGVDGGASTSAPSNQLSNSALIIALQKYVPPTSLLPDVLRHGADGSSPAALPLWQPGRLAGCSPSGASAAPSKPRSFLLPSHPSRQCWAIHINDVARILLPSLYHPVELIVEHSARCDRPFVPPPLTAQLESCRAASDAMRPPGRATLERLDIWRERSVDPMTTLLRVGTWEQRRFV